MSIISFKLSSGELDYQNTSFNGLPCRPYISSTLASLWYIFCPHKFQASNSLIIERKCFLCILLFRCLQISF